MRDLDSYSLFCFMTLQEHQNDAPSEADEVECACRNFLKEEEKAAHSEDNLTSEQAMASAAELVNTDVEHTI